MVRDLQRSLVLQHFNTWLGKYKHGLRGYHQGRRITLQNGRAQHIAHNIVFALALLRVILLRPKISIF